MNLANIKTIARKELRSYFLSPVALIFLGAFLAVTLFIFFNYSKFFARNLADVRPLFSWLPILLIFLVSAVTMRQWSEEQKMGTLEILMTLPIKTTDLVLGKFVAGLTLVGLALLLTVPLPISVSMMGNLDWGPVIGGYLGALLMASTYMAIGLCVSARTDNQIVALMVTATLGALFYLVGSDAVTNLVSNQSAEILHALGTGSRFASIERGVIDLRDLVYYGSLTGFFLVLNVYFLQIKRLEKQPSGTKSSRPAMTLMVGLVLANVIALNVWLSPIGKVRADLTADGDYSISQVTEDILADLQEPLVITGYFSEKTHPLLAPLVPRLRDFLKEYGVRGGEHVRLTFQDPNTDKELEEEISEQYDIKAVPFRVSGRHEEAVVKSFFHILIKYGDEYKVLSFGDLIEIHADESEATIRLRNIEYDITSTIKKVTQGFQSIDAVLARSEQTVKLTAYVSSTTLPEEYKEVPKRLQEIADELSASSGGRFVYEHIDPTGNTALQDDILRKYGFKPMAVDLFGKQRFYMYFLFQSGKRFESVFPPQDPTKAALRAEIEAAIKRSTPGFLKTIGFATRAQPQQPSPYGQQPSQPADLRAMRQAMQAEFTIKDVDLKSGAVPGDIDILIVGKLDLDDKGQFALDQYLMRGGSMIVLAGGYEIAPDRQQGGIISKPTDAKLLDLLETYGVKIEQKFIMDPQNARFPVSTQRGPFRDVRYVDYPFFPDIRQEGFNAGHVALAGIQSMVLTWASPLILSEIDGVKSEVLVHSSDGTWLNPSSNVMPDVTDLEAKFPRPEGIPSARANLAATLVGTFPSHFADKPSPLFGTELNPKGEATPDADRTGRTIKKSTPNARLAVVGSSEFGGDLVASLGREMGGGLFRGNGQFVRNLIDWSSEDTDLLQIRSAGAFARTLRPMEDSERWTYELSNYAIALLALLAVLLLAASRRRMTRPITLTEPQDSKGASA